MDEPITPVRLDVWLDVACLYHTRSEAQKACKGGKVDVNGQRAKPHRDVRTGDDIAITRRHGVKQMVTVRALAESHLPKPAARALYNDRTPPPSAEDREFRELLRRAGPPAGAPDKRQRRRLRSLKRQ